MPRSKEQGLAPLRQSSRRVAPSRNELLALGHAPASCLTLPVLAADVPIASKVGHQSDTRIAAALIQGGVLQEQHWPANRDIGDALARAVDSWMEWPKQQFSVTFTDNYQRTYSNGFSFSFGDLPERLIAPRDPNEVGLLSIVIPDSSFRLLERRWKEIEKVAPGLAPTVMAALDRALSMTTGSIDPGLCLSFAQHHYWQGEDNETNSAEELKEQGLDESEMYKRSAWDATMPQAAYSFYHDKHQIEFGKLTRAQLRTKLPSSGVRVSDVVDLVVAVRKQIKKLYRLRDADRKDAGIRAMFNDICQLEEQSELAAGYFFRWNLDDDCIRMADMQHDMESQCGCVMDCPFIRLFDMNKPADILHAFRLARECLYTTKLVEPLIDIISEPENRSRA